MGQKIVDLLPTGEENAIRAKDLVRLAGLSSVRELQKEISRERARGMVILSRCAAGGGYFRPASDDETRRFIATVGARSRNTALALQSAKASLLSDENEKAAPDAANIEDGIVSGRNH